MWAAVHIALLRPHYCCNAEQCGEAAAVRGTRSWHQEATTGRSWIALVFWASGESQKHACSVWRSELM